MKAMTSVFNEGNDVRIYSVRISYDVRISCDTVIVFSRVYINKRSNCRRLFGRFEVISVYGFLDIFPNLFPPDFRE